MPPPRLSHRVAWDHSVLVNRSAELDWAPRARPVERHERGGQPLLTLFTVWGLLLWSGVTAWGLWTTNELDSHISMRFLMRGDFEEVAGVLMGLIWAALPASAAFYLSRRIREITMDEIGAREYWASMAVIVVAGMGVLRPTWDPNAGSRFARGVPASQPAGTLTSMSDAGAAEAQAVVAVEAPAVDSGLVASSGAVAASGPGSAEVTDPAMTAVGTRHWARARLAAMRRGFEQQQAADARGTDSLVEGGAPFYGPTAEAAGFDDEP